MREKLREKLGSAARLTGAAALLWAGGVGKTEDTAAQHPATIPIAAQDPGYSNLEEIFKLISENSKIPKSLADVFTTDPEQMHGGYSNIIAVEAVNDNEGNTSDIIMIISGGLVQKVVLNEETGKYQFVNLSTKVPMTHSSSLIGFPNIDGDEKIVVTGHEVIDSTQFASAAISNDGGKTFESFLLKDSEGKNLEGSVSEVKLIPNTQKAILRVEDGWGDQQKYVLYDAQNDIFIPVSGQYEALPKLNDVYVNPQDPSLLTIIGVVEGENPSDTSIGELRIDLLDGFITSLTIREENLPNLVDVAVVRDEEGNPKIIYALETKRHFMFPERIIHRVDYRDGVDSDKYTKIDYGFPLDVSVVEELKKKPSLLNAANLEADGVIAYASNITVVDPSGEGILLTGDYWGGERAVAAFGRIDKDNPDTIIYIDVSAFGDFRMSPEAIAQEPEAVKLGNGQEDVEGFLFNTQAGGASFKRTQDNKPHGSPLLYLEREQPSKLKTIRPHWPHF